MSKTRERIVEEKIYPLSGFKELVRNFFGNGEEYIEDADIDKAVAEIRGQENPGRISKLEEALTTSTGGKSGKKSKTINVNAERKSATKQKEKVRDEER